MIQYIFGAIHEEPFCFERVLCYNAIWDMGTPPFCHAVKQIWIKM